MNMRMPLFSNNRIKLRLEQDGKIWAKTDVVDTPMFDINSPMGSAIIDMVCNIQTQQLMLDALAAVPACCCSKGCQNTSKEVCVSCVLKEQREKAEKTLGIFKLEIKPEGGEDDENKVTQGES